MPRQGQTLNEVRRTSTSATHDAASSSTSAPHESTVESVSTLRMPFGKHRGVALRDVPLSDLQSARDWSIQKRREYPGFLEAVALLERSEPVAA
jgi:hypothetical protein